MGRECDVGAPDRPDSVFTVAERLRRAALATFGETRVAETVFASALSTTAAALERVLNESASRAGNAYADGE